MKIAVTSQNYKTITPHAGRTRRFIVYEATPGAEPIEVDRLDLPKELSMHEFHDNPASHPLDEMDVLIVGSCGPQFAHRMSERGVKVISTKKSDPLDAVHAYLEDPEAAAAAQYLPTGGHGHGHGAGHRH